MKGSTGQDDLRSDCHAVLRVFLKGNPNPIVFDPIFGYQKENTPFDVPVDIGDVRNATDINSFQLEHVSVENFGSTRDNWNLNYVEFWFKSAGNFPQLIAGYGNHRFTGDSPVIDIPVGSMPP